VAAYDPKSISVRVGLKTKLRVFMRPGPVGSIEHEFAAMMPGGFFGAPVPDPMPALIFAEWFPPDDDETIYYGIIETTPGDEPGMNKVGWSTIYQWMPLG
jgi:hypothetical protein